MKSTGTPRWLDPDQQRSWYLFAYALIRLPAAFDTQMQRDAEISHHEYLVMSALSMAPERTLRMTELAKYTASSLSRLSNIAVRLEKRGWLRRSTDPADGRVKLAALTQKGYNKVVAAAPAHVDEVRRLVFDPLTNAQQRELGRICERILGAIDPDKPMPGAAPVADRRSPRNRTSVSPGAGRNKRPGSTENR